MQSLPIEEHTFVPEDIIKLNDAINRFNSFPNLNIENMHEIYKLCFKEVKLISTHFKPNPQQATRKLYRIVAWDKPPLQISKCNFNPDAVQQRCNIAGSPVFYGTGSISSGIMESIFRTQENLNLYQQKDCFVGKKFVIGQWLLNAEKLFIHYYIHNKFVNNQAITRLQNKIIQSYNNSFNGKELSEQKIIIELREISQQIFFGKDINLSSFHCYDKMYINDVDVLGYLTAIDSLHAINYCIHPRIALNPEILEPIHFNFCEINPFPKVKSEYAFIGYKILKVGIPDIEKDEICWLDDKDSFDKYQINDVTPNIRLI